MNLKQRKNKNEIRKLTATYTSSPQWLIPISIEYIKKSSITAVSLRDFTPHKLAGVYEGYFKSNNFSTELRARSIDCRPE